MRLHALFYVCYSAGMTNKGNAKTAHPFEGRTVSFRDKTGAFTTGVVSAVGFGSLDLTLADGTESVIHYPFLNDSTRFIDAE